MSNLTPELNLWLAVDDDDTADYLTASLGDSLNILDGLFNASTGHAHNGSHQGGALEFLDLTVGEDLTVLGASDLQGAVHMRSNLTVDGHTDLVTLDVSGTTLLHGAVTVEGGINGLNGLTISGPLTATGDITGHYLHTSDGANGAVYADVGNLFLRSAAGSQVILDAIGTTVTGYAQVNSWLAAGTNLSGTPGDITANRGGNTGYLWLGNASHHVGFDATNYVMPNANLYVNGDLVVTASAPSNLSNKAIYDPQMMNQVTLGGANYTLPTVTGNVGKWRYVKAWGQNLTMLLTNGTMILFGTQYSSGQYVLRNGDSLSIYCDGSNWWVL